MRCNADEACIPKRRVALHVRDLVTLVLICLLGASGPVFSQTPARETGRISGVRSVLHGTFLSTTRYSRIYDFDVYFSLRTRQKSYCVDYETVILDEIQNLVISEGKDLDIRLDVSKNKITLYTPQGRKLKARIVHPNLCESPAIAYTSTH